jgi:hypothetical protein
VRIGADERVRIGVVYTVALGVEHDTREVLDVHLMDDAGVRRDDLEIVEGILSPAQERIAPLLR